MSNATSITYKKKPLYLSMALCCALSFSHTANAEPDTLDEASNTLAVGAAVMHQRTAYHGYDNRTLVIPHIRYQSQRFYVRGLEAGFHALNTKEHQINLTVAYSPLEFDPSKTENRQLRQLDRRRATAVAGVGYIYRSPIGAFGVSATTDILGEHKGVLANAHWQNTYTISKLRITPHVGIDWHSSKVNDHFYGISRAEASRSGLSQYSAGSGVSPYLSLSAHYSITPNWGVFGFAKHQWLSSSAKDSPMVNKSYTQVLGGGVEYRF